MATLVKVKICGLTRFEDALIALDAGADYLGFILYPPSPRAVSPEIVAAIAARLHAERREVFAQDEPPRLVGVFVNETAEYMAATLDSCRLDLAQLSGDEDARLLSEPLSPLAGRGYKAIRPTNAADANALSARYAYALPDGPPRCPQLLLDAPHALLYGGTGQTGDWVVAAEFAAKFPGLMLAGGLNPENVARAVGRVRPFGVDVASGVESTPGLKDHQRVRDFITRAKSA